MRDNGDRRDREPGGTRITSPDLPYLQISI
jgi:hypothetical protein